MTDRNAVVLKDGGSSMGMVLGIIAVILVIAGLWYFLVGPGAGGRSSTSGSDTNINVTLPSVAPAGS